MDVIINNATPGATVQMVPQQYVPALYGIPYSYGPGYDRHGGFPGSLLVLLILGAVLIFRRRRAWRHWPGGPGGPAGGNLGDEVRNTFRRGRSRFLNDGALDIARAFERFYRTDASRTRDAQGRASSGLGLAIARPLVEAQGEGSASATIRRGR